MNHNSNEKGKYVLGQDDGGNSLKLTLKITTKLIKNSCLLKAL